MTDMNGRNNSIIDAHVHIWNKFAGVRFGDTVIEPLGWGMVRQAGKVYRFLPPEYRDNQAYVEILIANMNENGVDKAVLLQNPCYGDQRDYVRDVIAANPGRFVSLGMIDPRDKVKVLQEMDTLFNDYKFKGFKIEVPDVPFVMDDPEYDFLWRRIIDLGAVVSLDLGWNQGPYDFNIDRFRNVMKKFPTIRAVLCHLGISRLWDPSQEYPFPVLQSTLSLLDINKDNLYFDFSGLQSCDPSGEYPYFRCLDFLRAVKETCGLDRVMWGSDAPMLLRTCTYRQTITCLTRHCDFLTDDDYNKLLYKNAEEVYFR